TASASPFLLSPGGAGAVPPRLLPPSLSHVVVAIRADLAGAARRHEIAGELPAARARAQRTVIVAQHRPNNLRRLRLSDDLLGRVHVPRNATDAELCHHDLLSCWGPGGPAPETTPTADARACRWTC